MTNHKLAVSLSRTARLYHECGSRSYGGVCHPVPEQWRQLYVTNIPPSAELDIATELDYLASLAARRGIRGVRARLRKAPRCTCTTLARACIIASTRRKHRD